MDLPILDISYKQDHTICDLFHWALWLSIIISKFVHVVAYIASKFCCFLLPGHIPLVEIPFISWWTVGLFLVLSYCEECSCEHLCAFFCVDVCFNFLEEEMETHSSILAWRTPWTEKLQSKGSQESDTTEWAHVLIFLGYRLRSGIAELHNNSCIVFWETAKVVVLFYIPISNVWISIFSTFSPALNIVSLFIINTLEALMVLIYISLAQSWTWLKRLSSSSSSSSD